MQNRTASRLAWSLFAAFLGLAGAGLWFSVANERGTIGNGVLVGVLSAMGAVGALVASRQPGNAVGWLYLAFAGTTAVTFSADEYARFGLVTTPGSVPAAVWAAFASDVLWVGILTIPFVFLPMVFPDGKLPSRRWRAHAWVAAAFVTFAAVVFALDPHHRLGVENPLAVEAVDPIASFMEGPGFGVLIALGLGSFGSLVMRYRRAGRDQRQQIKWVVYGLALLVAWFGVEGITQLLGVDLPRLADDIGVGMAYGALPVTSGVAVLRHRLFDVDVVISKTVLYGLLAAIITGIYVTFAVGIGAFIGSRGSLPLSIMATAAVAVAFQPLRQRLSHLANRLVYGKRATPYEVLSEFADRMATTYSLDDVLPRLTRLVAEGTGARRVGIWVRVGGELRREALWPVDADGWPSSLPAEDAALGELADVSRTIPVRQGGELLGGIAIDMPPAEPLTPTGEKLLDDVAAQAALVLRNVALLEELRASRKRLVAAQDEERRKLERNIHDGAQQQLVALALKLGLVERLADRDPGKARAMAAEARSETQEALENLRDLARGIYPPLLADQGLAAALRAQARRKLPFRVDVEPNGVARYPQDVEAAVYFSVLEALQNASKYAEASRAVVRLKPENGGLFFEVQDNGRGFDPASTPRGTGLQNIADRLEALGGNVEVRSAPGQGTRITGRVSVARGERR